MSDGNAFGGRNKHSLYIPLTEIEQEVLHRLAERGDYRVHVKGWGMVEDPHVIIGDLRVSVQFQLMFTKPKNPMPVYFMDMELRTGAGRLLHKGRMDTLVANKPIMVSEGLVTNFAWDIALTGLDPKLVREVIPDTTGLTSRQQDKDSREFTSEGNMSLDAKQKMLLRALRKGEKVAQNESKKDLAKAIARSKKSEDD